MHPKLWLSVLVAVVFIGGAIGLVVWNESQPETEPAASSLAGSSSENSFTLGQIVEHGDATSCWTTIEGKVYDLTEYIEKHPGGSKSILAICGEDGTGPFNSMPGSVMAAAKLALAKFVIGDLAK